MLEGLETDALLANDSMVPNRLHSVHINLLQAGLQIQNNYMKARVYNCTTVQLYKKMHVNVYCTVYNGVTNQKVSVGSEKKIPKILETLGAGGEFILVEYYDGKFKANNKKWIYPKRGGSVFSTQIFIHPWISG